MVGDPFLTLSPLALDHLYDGFEVSVGHVCFHGSPLLLGQGDLLQGALRGAHQAEVALVHYLGGQATDGFQGVFVLV